MEIKIEQFYTTEEIKKRSFNIESEKDIFIVSINYNEKDWWQLTIDEDFKIYKSCGFGLIDMSNPDEFKKEILEKINEYRNIQKSRTDNK